MKNIKKVVATAVVGVLMFSVVGCDMIQKTPEAIKKTTVAKVDGEKVTLGEVDDKLKQVIDQIKQQYGDKYEKSEEAKTMLAEQRKNALDGIVAEKVMIKEAAKLKIGQDKAEVDKVIDEKVKQVKAMYGNDDKKLDEALKTNNLTMASLKETIKNQYIQQKLQEFISKDIKATDEEGQKYIDTNKSAEISHILVKTEEEAKKIKAEYDGGAKFEDLAAKYGTDGTKDKGGSLGVVPFNTDQMDKDFMAAAKTLKQGQVSNPVKSQFGWHLIKVDGKKALIQQKTQQEISKKLEEWKKELKVETYADKLK